jgi:nudix-type nucleoside diphosphatase (YffH/AdpP family)
VKDEEERMGGKVLVKKRTSTKFGPFRIDEVKLEVEQRNGSMAEYDRVSFERGDAVAVLALNKETGTVYLTRQFRYPVLANAADQGDGWITELVAGIQDDGETPDMTARREVEEEIGCIVQSLEHVATFFVSPGGTSERIMLFFAQVSGPQAGKGGGLAEEGEDIELVSLPVAEFLADVESGVIKDAKTLIAGYWLKSRGASAAR